MKTASENDPRHLDYLRRRAFPTLRQLNADPNAATQIYDVGFLLGEFVVAGWGTARWCHRFAPTATSAACWGCRVRLQAASRAYVVTRYLS